eukprot:9379389-Karenia_brevis.AAC.1
MASMLAMNSSAVWSGSCGGTRKAFLVMDRLKPESLSWLNAVALSQHHLPMASSESDLELLPAVELSQESAGSLQNEEACPEGATERAGSSSRDSRSGLPASQGSEPELPVDVLDSDDDVSPAAPLDGICSCHRGCVSKFHPDDIAARRADMQAKHRADRDTEFMALVRQN